MIIKKSNNQTLSLILISAVLLVFFLALKPSINKKKKIALVVPQIEQKTALQSIQITIREKHYKKLKKKRDKDFAAGVMISDDSDYVPAIITYNKQDYKATVRLKGDWTDHLEGQKWSFRIKLKGDKTILGMRKFSIHHPKTRGYINEWLFHKTHKLEGLIGLRYNFAEGFLHIKQPDSINYQNKNLGIYAIEEAFDKRTIESNHRKEGVILRFSESNYWKEIKAGHAIRNQVGYSWVPVLSPTFSISKSGHIATFGLARILEDEELHKQFIQAKNILNIYSINELEISEAFDVKKLALHVALTNLFGAHHGFSQINLRVYYNPTTSLLEPISSDGNAGLVIEKFRHYYSTNLEDDVNYTKALIQALEKVSTPAYLEKIFQSNEKEIISFETILEKEFNSKAIINKENYIKNQLILKQEITYLKGILNKKLSEN